MNKTVLINKAVVLSDLHIGWDKSNIDGLLDKWDEIIPKGADIIFAGDVLDLWRNKELNGNGAEQFCEELIKKLINQNGSIHYVIGNHDFHVLRVLQKKSNGTPNLLKFVEDLKKVGAKFYHPYFQFKSGKKTFCCTHGDNFDFLYWYEMLQPELKVIKNFKPSCIYEWFYEIAYKDNGIALQYAQHKLPRLIFEYLEASLGGLVSNLASNIKEEIAKKVKSIGDWVTSWCRRRDSPLFKTHPEEIAETVYMDELPLRSIYEKRFPKSLNWPKGVVEDANIIFYHPYDVQLDKSEDLNPNPSVIILGHFHDPRRYSHFYNGKFYEIYDVGACAEGLISHLTIDAGKVSQVASYT